MGVRVERKVAAQVIRQLRKPIDAEVRAQNALECERPDTSSGEACKVPQRCAAQAWGTRSFGHVRLVTRPIASGARKWHFM